MTKTEYDNLSEFPTEMVSKTPYYSNGIKLFGRGDAFTAVGKKTIGTDDYSIIDQFGHPHYYDGCDLLHKD